MDVTSAIMQRRSIRAYLPKPVSKETLEEILDKARWSPSGTYTQSWFIEAVSGDAKVKLSEAMAEAGRIDPEGRPFIPFPDYDAKCMQRRRNIGYSLYSAKGIARDDRRKRAMWYQHNLRFFGAPVALVVHTCQAYSPFALPDMGIIAMSIMLLAKERGLGTCVEYMPTRYPDVLKDFLHIPEDHIVVLAIAMGYPDLDDRVNNFPREREPLSKFVRFVE
ncbi:MAG: nitroreductase [Dehalococcoidia bacterium]|nr:nitroreductase [Dehalococcoidia bacterium]